MHEIQEEIFTQAKFYGKILTKDAVCCFILFQVATSLQERTYGPLGTVAFLFVIFMGIYWLLPSRGNYRLRNYQRLVIILTSNRQTYHPITQQPFQDKEELSMAMLTEQELLEEDRLLAEEMNEND
ncbi:hypothetical protein D929_00179 [Enterococcus faecalis 02-MB-P-10]|uniref:DUF5592 family protein n=1 Tax=Enterococcus faecalis TaxID=1351 RepID=UPI00035420C0|nr:DUF5592 family protein [Enterococcus faecalis]EPH77110.1 hypothetical protein D929_00179 [Enterococcus faecalis 02-MB-P-10]